MIYTAQSIFQLVFTPPPTSPPPSGGRHGNELNNFDGYISNREPRFRDISYIRMYNNLLPSLRATQDTTVFLCTHYCLLPSIKLWTNAVSALALACRGGAGRGERGERGGGGCIILAFGCAYLGGGG